MPPLFLNFIEDKNSLLLWAAAAGCLGVLLVVKRERNSRKAKAIAARLRKSPIRYREKQRMRLRDHV